MQPQQPITHHYLSEDQYTADAARLTAAGWRVVSVQRDPDDGVISATWLAPAVLEPQMQPQLTPPPTMPQPNMLNTSGREQARALRYLVALIGGALLVAGICGAIASAFGSRPAGSSSDPLSQVTAQATVSSLDATATAAASATQAAAQAAAQATSAAFAASLDATATATSAPAPVLVAGPHLGAPIDDFDSAFGPEQGSGTWYTTVSGQSIMVTVQAASDTSGQITTPDGQDRVWSVTLTYLGAAPSATQNAAICRQFLPSDAQHITDNASASPTEHIYRSNQLAASFDANAFQNNAGADVAPGMFDVVYSQSTCDVATGQE